MAATPHAEDDGGFLVPHGHGAGNLALKATEEAGREMGRRACVNVCLWHKADMLNALTNVRFWAKRTVTNRC
jgi:hypothetical protein